MLTHCKLCNRRMDAGDLDSSGICSECEPARARIASLEAEIEAERGRAEKATARCVELFDQFSAAVARAEKARWWKCPVCTEETETADVLAELRCPCCGHTSAPVLAAARSDAVREFAEWEERDEVIVEDETHVEAAARYLSERVR